MLTGFNIGRTCLFCSAETGFNFRECCSVISRRGNFYARDSLSPVDQLGLTRFENLVCLIRQLMYKSTGILHEYVNLNPCLSVDV